jgi:hypothetical protein
MTRPKIRTQNGRLPPTEDEIQGAIKYYNNRLNTPQEVSIRKAAYAFGILY